MIEQDCWNYQEAKCQDHGIMSHCSKVLSDCPPQSPQKCQNINHSDPDQMDFPQGEVFQVNVWDAASTNTCNAAVQSNLKAMTAETTCTEAMRDPQDTQASTAPQFDSNRPHQRVP